MKIRSGPLVLLLSLSALLISGGCEDDVTSPCLGTYEVAVTDEAIPVFTWTPDCGVNQLLVEQSTGEELWHVSGTANSIASGVRYGEHPPGASESRPDDPEVLRGDLSYRVTLARVVEDDTVRLRTRDFSLTDDTPPAQITDLVAAWTSDTSVTLSWTAPGDDDMRGTAENYDIRYLIGELDETTWEAATVHPSPPVPEPGGTTQSVTIEGLTPQQDYSFAIVSSDEMSQLSPLSNVVTARTEDWTSLILVVRPDGTGDHPTIQAAIDAADDHYIIELADGVFTGSGNRNMNTQGKTLTIRSQSMDPTICIIDLQGTEQDRALAFSFVSQETPNTRIEGITVKNGYESDGQGGSGSVGAVFTRDGASPTIEGCIFSGNYASALHLRGGSPAIIRCTFTSNSATSGGAVTTSSCTAVFTECVFQNNEATYAGGAVFSSGCLYYSCTFTGNSALRYGGACSIGSGEFHNCSFSDNVATDTDLGKGGAILVGRWVYLDSCTFSDHEASRGGSIHCEELSTLTMQNCMIRRSHATRRGGAIHSWRDSEVAITESIISDCSAGDYGGAISAEWKRLTLERVTLVRNAAPSGSSIYADEGCAVEINHSIIAFGEGGPAIGIYHWDRIPTLTCCNLYGNEGGDWVGWIDDQADQDGNFSLDPLFCDPEAVDLRLQPDSPCVDVPECGTIGGLEVGCGK